MHFDHHQYVPCLRWKQGEYDALFALLLRAKNYTTPLIEVAEFGYDFETEKEPKTIDEHLAKFGKRLKEKWRHRPSFIDSKLIESHQRMADGRHPIQHIFDQVHECECPAVPVTGVARDAGYQKAITKIVERVKQLCIRLDIEEACQPNVTEKIDNLLRLSRISASASHLVIDLGSPNSSPIEGFAKIVEKTIRAMPYLADWQTFSIIGTAFPSSMAEVSAGLEAVQRNEWLLYRQLVSTLAKENFRIPAFGDYGINHPDVLSLDMRVVKPSATIRYTTDTSWIIVKGKNVRDNGYEQYKQLCKDLINAGGFLGSSFSFGDDYIAKCAKGQKSTGNLTTWRKVGTNHHIEKVVHDLANFFDSLGI